MTGQVPLLTRRPSGVPFGAAIDPRDYGARYRPDDFDDLSAIQSAVNDADAATFAGDPWPCEVVISGRARCDGDLIVPARLNSAIAIRGLHRRNCIIAFSDGFGMVLGDLVTNAQYFELHDLTISAYGGSGTGIGLRMRLPQQVNVRRINIEGFSGVGGTGLFLEGSAGAGAPHAWRGLYDHLVIATCTRPLRLLNADENTFRHCGFGLPLGKGVAVVAIQIEQGRNNRFYSTLCAGDTGASRPNYRGVQLDTPAVGNNGGHTFDGLVCEGFDIGFFIASSVVTDIDVRRYASSINRAAYNNGSDDGSVNNERRNNVRIEMNGGSAIGGVRDYRAGGFNPSESLTITSGDTSPSITGSDSFAFANAGATNVDNFDDGRPGDLKWFRLDANTTIRNNAPGNIRTAGGANIVGTANDMVAFKFMGGLWFQATPVVAIP